MGNEADKDKCTVLGRDTLTVEQLEVIDDLEKRRGPARVYAIPAGSVFVQAGDFIQVLEPQPSGLIVIDCGTGRAIPPVT